MIKVSSRFLAVLMLAVLAFTDVTTTSAFAGGPLHIFRSAPTVDSVLRHQLDSLRPGRVEDLDVMHMGLSGDTWLVNLPPKETIPRGLRPYPYVDPVMGK
jgi:hypothetical protein